MRHRYSYLAAVAIATIFVFAPPLSLDSSLSSPCTDGTEPPDPAEILLLEELRDWMVAGPSSRASRPIANDRIRNLLRENPDGLQLFRRYAGIDADRRLLDGIPFGETIREVAKTNRVDSLLLASIVEVESSFNPRVVSPKGAMGLTQLMPTTAAIFGVSDPFDPLTNLDAGAQYLGHLLERFDADLELALAAYNAGPTVVSRYGRIPPFRETRNYVERVLSTYLSHHRALWEEAVVEWEVGEAEAAGAQVSDEPEPASRRRALVLL